MAGFSPGVRSNRRKREPPSCWATASSALAENDRILPSVTSAPPNHQVRRTPIRDDSITPALAQPTGEAAVGSPQLVRAKTRCRRSLGTASSSRICSRRRPWRPSGRCRPRPRRRPSSGTSRTTPSGGRATQLRHADHEHRDTRKRVREGEVAQERKRQARPTRDVCRPPSETTTALKLGGIGRVVGSTEIRGCRRLSGFPVRAAPSRRGRRRGRARL